MDTGAYIVVLVISYFPGSVPAGFLAGKARGCSLTVKTGIKKTYDLLAVAHFVWHVELYDSKRRCCSAG